MNNSSISLESTQSDEIRQKQREALSQEESRLIQIIEDLREIQATKAWSSLKTEVFDNLVNVLEKGMRTEAESDDPKPTKLNRIAGELKWARRFSDLSRFENEKKVELQRVRIALYGNKSE